MKIVPENKSRIILHAWIGFQLFPILLLGYIWHLALNKHNLPFEFSKTKKVSNGPWSFYEDLSEGLAMANGLFIISFLLSFILHFIKIKGENYGILCSALSFGIGMTAFVLHYELLD